ncbi:leucine-rich repeat-containing protein kinase family protein [Zoogloea sp.]|uniref:leucine-rich repeat-containing protein kinase family protein n=1 Tax=Zoogloea sp. TaxID=49181 RepID=UPI002617AEF8|nr:leucine-rich repeat-containing protein kinase family protein [Zoogloea sp.]
MHTLEQLRAGKLAGARHLKIACGLETFPREIFDLADTLEILDLSGNALAALPDDLPRLTRLRVLFCSGSPFEVLPEVLGACPALEMIGFKGCRIRRVPEASLPPTLRWLILTDNRVEALPASIGQCSGLQKLALAGNRLTRLPPEMAACTRLELLRIAANALAELPDWLLRLPRLAWLAYAGNPFCAAVDEAMQQGARVPPVDWNALELAQVLGEGASGVIYRAEWADSGRRRDVAVKLFKGAVTSDGLPRNEMAACVEAGAHPNLIPVLGRLEAHPDATEGLVMALIDSGFRSLAGPPSLESCTRDIYPAGTRFTPEVALAIARGIASAAAHLHGRGILHGDLYAHNILHCGQGRVLLGDFGAASCVPPHDRQAAEALQRIELRAFGCLLEELLAACDEADRSSPALQPLAALQARCLTDSPDSRPLFAEVVQALAG